MATKKIEDNIAETAKETAKEKTFKIRVPIDPLNPTDKDIIVGINEKYAKVVRGEDTEVSEPVYEVLKNAGLV
ncbi:MAG: hypothetical protein II625_01850 [Bacilli bacterium]|nr:hypothetical protein [Bacilli bacterium]